MTELTLLYNHFVRKPLWLTNCLNLTFQSKLIKPVQNPISGVIFPASVTVYEEISVIVHKQKMALVNFVHFLGLVMALREQHRPGPDSELL